MMLIKGQQVTLWVPENPRLHGAVATVLQPMEWGALVETTAAATGEYRAAHDEMVPLEGNGQGDQHRTTAKLKGYCGEACDFCGSFKVLRSGPCLKCEDCGASGGCG